MMAHSKISTVFLLLFLTLLTSSILRTLAASRSNHLTGTETTFFFLAFYTTSIFTFGLDHGNQECARIAKFQKCLSQSSSPASMLTTPHSNSSFYHKLNQPWNTRKPKATPIGYFLPTSTPDVQNAVRCGVLANIKLTINSGGHSYEGLSWGDDSTIILDFRKMGQISLTKEEENKLSVKTSVAIIQPGALLGPIYAQLWTLGRVGISAGTCVTVGIGGHAIGGGVGYFSQTFGLAVDNVLQVEMVDATGKAVIASAKENQELFWGVRGMGPGYLGIVTKFWMKTFRADELKFTYVRLVYELADFVKVAQAHQEFVEWARIHEPGSLNWLTIYPGEIKWTAKEPLGLFLELVHIFDPVRNPKSNSSFLTKLEETFPPAPDKTVAYPSYLPFISVTSNDPQREEPKEDQKSAKDGQDFNLRKPSKWPPAYFPPVKDVVKKFNKVRKGTDHRKFYYAKSLFSKRYLTLEELTRMGEVIKRIPNNNICISLYPETGEVQKVAKSSTAYVHRDALISFQVDVQVEAWEEEGAIGRGMAFLNSLWAAAQSFDGGETSQSFPDLAAKDFLKRHYGSNLARLVELKRVWDPQNYFTNPMSIPVKLDEGCDKN